ncbi:hypothetical protein Leryth_003032 [Lithospermum erythrorhizon]|nr:hypothetical protein Leryth_003032 [Lithospermum erythrorhizon]
MTSSSLVSPLGKENKELGWVEWLRAWYLLICEILFQKLYARHLQNPLPLPSLGGYNCIVTGATSGIGLEIARQLAESGAHVVMAVRNTSAARKIIQKWQAIKSDGGSLDIDVMELDLLSLESVVKFSEAWNLSSRPLHSLINNAGIFSMGQPQTFSKDGFETHLQVNHLAPSLLSILLLPSLQKGSPSRIVNVNSLMHRFGVIDSNDMNFTSQNRKFTSAKAYESSKLAEVMFSSVLQKHLPTNAGIYVLCVDPGTVRTNVARDIPKLVQAGYHYLPFLFNAQEGSRSSLFAATDPDVTKYCMKLMENEWPVCAYIASSCRPVNPSREAHNVGPSQSVWERTLEMAGLPPDAVEKLLEGKEIHCRYGI